MRAPFHDPAGLHHQDQVRGPDGGQPVRDDEGRPALQRLREGLLDGRLGGVVQVGGGLVQQDDPLPGEEQPGDGHALALTAGEAVAALPDHRVQAVGQGAHQVVQAGAAQRVPQVGLARGGRGQQQVGADGVVEEVAVLGDHAEGVAQRFRGQVPHVDSAHPHRARVDVVEARQQLRDGRLAGAGGADEGHGLPGFGAEGDAVQDLGASARVQGGDLLQGGEGDLVRGRVAEADVVELDGDRALGGGTGVRFLLDERLQVQHLEDPLEADQCAHHLHPGPGEGGQRRVQAGQQQGQGHDRAGFQGTAQGEVAADAVDEGQGEGGDEGERGDEHGLGGGRPYADVPDPAGAHRELLRLLPRAAEEFDQGGAGRREALGHPGGHGRVQGGGLALHPGHAAAHAPGGDHEHGQQHQGEQGDPPGQGEHHGQGERQRDDVADHGGQGVAEGPLGADHVVVETGDERARAGAGEERDRHPLHVVEDGGPQVEDEFLAEGGRQPPAEDAEGRLRHRDQRDEQGQPDDRGRVAVGDDGVDDASGQDGGGDGEQRGGGSEQDEEGHAAAVRAGEARDAAQRVPREGAAFLLGVHDAVQLGPGCGLHAHAEEGRTSSIVEVKVRRPFGARVIPSEYAGGRGTLRRPPRRRGRDPPSGPPAPAAGAGRKGFRAVPRTLRENRVTAGCLPAPAWYELPFRIRQDERSCRPPAGRSGTAHPPGPHSPGHPPNASR